MYKGKAIYNPSGKANEYSYWACNFYVGCSNECSYCYLKKGIGKKTLGGNKPTLKKCFKDEMNAIEVFEKELIENLKELRSHGLFFSFTTDPMLPETMELTIDAISVCQEYNVPVKILTKTSDYLYRLHFSSNKWNKSIIAIGFTLTGRNELELNATSNEYRIYAMKELKEEGYKIFASIEPIITFEDSKRMIELTQDFCDLYKIGLEGGKKYDTYKALKFIGWLNTLQGPKIYIKESLRKLTLCTNVESYKYFVEKDYDMFK